MYVCRLNDGVIPRQGADGGLITDAERRLFSSHGIATSMDFAKSAIRERFDLYSAMTCASDELIMSCHAFGAKGDKKEPSPYLDAVRRCASLTPLTADGLEPEFYLVSRAGAADLASGGRYLPETDEAPFRDPHSEEALPPDVIESLYGGGLRLSFSGLQTYFTCPFRFFLDKGLKLSKNEEVKMNYNDVGLLVHWGFEHLLSGEYDLENADDAAIDRYVADVVKKYRDGPLKDTKEFSHRYDRLFGRAAKIFLRSAGSVVREMNTSGFKPFGFEIDISDFVPKADMPGGGKLSLTGYIDRVDVLEKDGKRYAKIIDYKSGKKAFDLKSIYNGVEMQLPFYAGALRQKYPDMQIAAIYYLNVTPDEVKLSDKPISDAEYAEKLGASFVRSGAFTGADGTQDELGDGVVSKKMAQYTESAMDALIELTDGKLREAANGISGGDVRVSPLGEESCRYCDYRGLCRINEHPENTREMKELPEGVLE